MDLGSECSAHESVEDNELTTTAPDGLLNLGNVKVNGSCSNEIHDVGSSRDVDTNAFSDDRQVKDGEGMEQVGDLVNSPPLTAKSPSGGLPSPVTKGFGLRKWRRIRRDVPKDTSANADSGKVLKRGFSGPGNPTARQPNIASGQIKQNSETSVGTVNVFRNIGVAHGFSTHGSSLESRFAVGSAFAAGADSENSEDRSSKSSTAASAPRMRYDLPTVLGNLREKNRTKNIPGKSIASSSQRVQPRKGQVEGSKKPRGDRVKLEKENSHSSMESDSRSSNLVFMQGHYSMTSNGDRSRRSMNFDGENSDDTHEDEQQLGEEVHTGYNEENAGEAEDHSQNDFAADASWEDKEERSENNGPSAARDPLIESILCLQSVQEALQCEVQKMVEIGNMTSIPDDSTITDPGAQASSHLFDSENVREAGFLESQVLTLTENVKNLESRLVESEAMLKVKESRVAELEATLNGESKEMEAEFEGLLKQKLEADVEYLVLESTIQKLTVAAGDQITIFKEQEALVGGQTKMLNKLGEAESKATMLKKQAEELEKYRGDILGTEEVLKMQRRAFKLTSCFCIQLILLVLLFWLLGLQSSHRSADVVPT